ncbi:hypothetical protein ACFL6H_09710 [Candidatus Latescibacterota bacterium]
MQNETYSDRRSFLKNTAGIFGAASLGAPLAAKAQDSFGNRKLKIGVFGLDYTFWGIWTGLLNPEGTNFFNMEMSHVWDKDMKKAEGFAQKWGCKAVKRYDDMLGEVDGVVNGGFYNVPWQHILFRPYIEAGVPAYLSRPWASRKRDLEEMLELAAKHNTPLIATATYEHYNEADNFKSQIKNIGEIESAFATCDAGDRPHFHVPYMMMKILGYNVEQVSMMTNDPRKSVYLQSTYIFDASENQKAFALTMHSLRSYVFSFQIIGRQGTENASMPENASFFNRFAPQLMDIQKTIATKTNYQPLDTVRKKHEMIMTEYYSHYERGGAPVKVGTVPQDWQYPLWKPDWYDGSEFRN